MGKLCGTSLFLATYIVDPELVRFKPLSAQNVVVGTLNSNTDHSGHRHRLFGSAQIAGLASQRIVHPGAGPLCRRSGTCLKTMNRIVNFLAPAKKERPAIRPVFPHFSREILVLNRAA
jgi:hypothetical protein